ncbi:MAG: methyltransferase domain-containing protein [Anaerolineaceae bacterium]|nr:methyltransferase domain-containing protein [Anaerolineaceae bacterium]
MMDQPPVCNYEGSNYQQQFWEQGGRAYEDAAEAIALKKLLPKQGKRLLELGAGAGRNTPRYKGYEEIVLLDYSTTQLQQAREFLGDDPKYRFVAADIYNMPFVDGLFDGATMIRTLHHMANAPLALQNIRDLLTENAIFILEYANKRNIKSIFRYLFKQQDWSPFSKEPVEFVELNFDFHPAAIREWLYEANFAVERQLTVSHFRVGFLKKHLPTKLLTEIDSILQNSGDFLQLSPSVFNRCCAIGHSHSAEEGTFFRCPICREPLDDTPPLLTCKKCGQTYPVVNGIYNFKI